MADNIFNPDSGGAVNSVKSIIIGATDTNLVESLKVGNFSQNEDNDAELSPDMGTITLGSTSPILDTPSGLGVFSCISGNLGFDLGSHSLVDGSVFFVNDGSGILSGAYQVLTVSGNTVCTTASYPSCGDASGTNLTWAVPSGTVDPQLAYFMVQDCQNPSVSNRAYSHKFITYISHLYTDCWDCFTGEYDPCDIDVTEVRLWEDQYTYAPKMYAVDSSKVLEGNSSGKSASVGADNPTGENKA